MLATEFVVQLHDCDPTLDVSAYDLADDKPYLVVVYKATPESAPKYTKVCVDAILKNTLDELLPILKGEEEPEKLYYRSRIVGYFSRINNWNTSKLGELKDRHKGHYSPSEP